MEGVKLRREDELIRCQRGCRVCTGVIGILPCCVFPSQHSTVPRGELHSPQPRIFKHLPLKLLKRPTIATKTNPATAVHPPEDQTQTSLLPLLSRVALSCGLVGCKDANTRERGSFSWYGGDLFVCFYKRFDHAEE